MARESSESLVDFRNRMIAEGWQSKRFHGDPLSQVRRMHSWYKPQENIIELSDEFHPKMKHFWWWRKKNDV